MNRTLLLSAALVLPLLAFPSWTQVVNEVAMPKSDLKKAWFKNANPGDYAEYGKSGATAKDYFRKEEVLEVKDSSITVRIAINEKDGFARQQILIRYKFTEPDSAPEMGVTLKKSQENLKVAGRTYKCQLIERFKDGKLQSKEWLSDAVPVMGTVKLFNAVNNEEIQLTRHSRPRSPANPTNPIKPKN